MKTKLYLLAALTFLTVGVYAQIGVFPQKYNFMLFEDWTNSSWTKSIKITNTYDSNGNLIMETTEVWNIGTNAWDKSLIISYTLNSNGTIKESLTQAWNDVDNVWEDVSKSIFTYNGSNMMLTLTTQMSLGGSWFDFQKSTSIYNSSNQLTSMVSQNYDFFTNQMKNTSQSTYSYNDDGTENQSVSQMWNASEQWENISRATNTYNGSKQITTELSEKWENSAWVNDSKITNTYNGSIQITTELSEKWENNVWVNESKMTNTYNASGTLKESIDESWLNNVWIKTAKNMMGYNVNGELEQLTSQEWNSSLSDWENKSRITFDLNTTGIQPVEMAGKASKVFPNPFEGNLTIEHGSLDEHGIQVFNATGQLVNSFKSTESVTTLNLGSLQKGIYFMKIKSPQNEQTIKLLKIR